MSISIRPAKDWNKKKEPMTLREERRNLELSLAESQGKGKKRVLMFALFSGLLFGMITFMLEYMDSSGKHLILTSVISISVGLGLFILVYWTGSEVHDSEESIIKRKLLKFETDDIQKQVQEDIFENSIKMSYNYLDQYYAQTREQAQKGFFITVCVSLLGAFLIGIGIIAMFLEKTTPSYVTCASGIITEFIAAVFFYLYNKTVISMSKYHNKLVLSHNISIALKVAESLPDDDKVKTKDLIISELLKDINSYLIRNDSEEGKK